MTGPSASRKKGDRLRLSVTDLTAAGLGVAHDGSLVCFIKDAVPGDEVEATVMKVQKNLLHAHLDRVITPSPDRIESPCPVARSCGGCQLQAYSYPAALAWKERQVRETLARIGGFPAEEIDRILSPIAGAEPAVYRYRNKAQLPVAPDRNGQPVIGFYAARTHSVIPVSDCLLTDPSFAGICALLLSYMERYGIPAYDERTGRGVLRHLLIRRGAHSGEIMVCLVVNIPADPQPAGDPTRRMKALKKHLPDIDDFAEQLFSGIPGMRSLSCNYNTSRGNVILGSALLPVRGDPCIEDTMCGLRFKISPLSFYQVNTSQAERLYEEAMSYAALSGTETVVDLYCGIGTISLLAARHAARVIGVEVVPAAVENARENAVLNGISNAEFTCGRAEDVLPSLAAGGIRPDVLIVDPPRAGLASSCIDAIRLLSPQQIVYVSCNPATLARDLRLLTHVSDSTPSYRLRRARAYDLFPQTGHVECVTLLQRMGTTRGENDHAGWS